MCILWLNEEVTNLDVIFFTTFPNESLLRTAAINVSSSEGDRSVRANCEGRIVEAKIAFADDMTLDNKLTLYNTWQ